MGLNIKDLTVTSPAFGFGDPIPREHSAEGDNVSPPLRWSGIPDGTRQLAVVCHDPDAPMAHGFTHWVVYGIPPSSTGIEEGGGGEFTEGANDFGNKGYGGPLPPEGHGRHHYFFFLYALGTEIEQGPGLTRLQLLDQISDHVVEMNRLVGTYER